MSDYIVEMHNIIKTFPGVKALEQVDFNLRAGEVLALLGENGAGKSTLMKVLSGVHSKDSGQIKVFGKNYETITPKLADQIGIAIIHQELNMCADLTVAENIFLGTEICNRYSTLDKKKMNQEAKKVLDQLNIDINPTSVVGDLSVSKQQMVEIAKAISKKSRILIMDEPTSALTSKEIDDLFKIIRNLKQDGCGIVYISHRLEELKHIVDRVTIMRDAKYILTKDFKELTMEEIIRHMVGREIKEQFPRIATKKGEKIFEVKNLNAGKMVKDISFSAYAGEILAIAGLMGSGRTETTRAIFGIDAKESGQVYVDGQSITIRSSQDAIQNGIVLVPEDRKKDGLCVRLSVRENISLPNLDYICNRFGVINSKRESQVTNQTIQNLQIKLPTVQADANTLSGGNQQKVVVGKWLARDFRVIIFDEPTRGIDVAAKVEIYNIMNQLKQSGAAVIFISSEMPEVFGMSDRILVMCDGKITGDIQTKEATQDQVLTYATMFEAKI